MELKIVKLSELMQDRFQILIQGLWWCFTLKFKQVYPATQLYSKAH